LGLAKVISQRSHDVHTQHGCVITDQNNRILGVGYNGYPRGLDDSKLPKDRPDKYPWMVHSERNALSNCVVRPDNGIAYVTGQCCNNCLLALLQNGITKIVMAKSHGTVLFDEKQQEVFDKLITMSSVEIEYFEPNYDWLKQLCGVL
jgi:dCMP deaminase